MGRKSKGPWFWKQRNEWVVNIRGVRHYLGADQGEAERQWHTLSAAKETESDPKALIVLLDDFLGWCEKNRPDSYDWYQSRITEFAKTVPELLTKDLKPHHVQSWIDTKKSSGHQRGCLIAVYRALNWATKQGHIEKNPLQHMDKPAAGKREVIIEEETYEKILSLCTDQNFRDLLTFCWETGCRPQEVVRLEKRHLDLKQERCVFPVKESKGKKKKRVIYLTIISTEIVERLSEKYPQGKIFRNGDAEPWKRNNIACRFARLQGAMGREILKQKDIKPTDAQARALLPKIPKTKRVGGVVTNRTEKDRLCDARKRIRAAAAKKLAPRYCLYNFRHTFCQRALKSGVDPITLAEIMGHSSAAMIMKIYQHIHQDSSHLRLALAKVK